MATSEEERLLETQLELQLQEQRDSLSALTDALASDPSNLELLSVSEELVRAIKDAEEGLLHLKRARLLREADSVLLGSLANNDHTTTHDKNVKEVTEPLDAADVDPEPLEDHPTYGVGSKCRFRHTDGRWYNGRIVALDGFGSATISFLTPTSENMLVKPQCLFLFLLSHLSICHVLHGWRNLHVMIDEIVLLHFPQLFFCMIFSFDDD